VVTCLDWSCRGAGRAADGFEQVHPLVLAVPAFGQVHSEVPAAVPAGARCDVDEVAADRGAAGSGAGDTEASATPIDPVQRGTFRVDALG
jgi:hypothetical protein